MELVVSRRAEHDIRLIFAYGLRTRGQAAADRYLEQLEDRFRRLLTFPEMERRDFSFPSDTRVVISGEHRVFYRTDRHPPDRPSSCETSRHRALINS